MKFFFSPFTIANKRRDGKRVENSELDIPRYTRYNYGILYLVYLGIKAKENRPDYIIAKRRSVYGQTLYGTGDFHVGAKAAGGQEYVWVRNDSRA